MKFSNYNICIDLFKEDYIYNSFTGALIKINGSYRKEIQNKNINFMKELSISEIEFLKKNGIIIEDSIDELKLIKKKIEFITQNTKEISLVIAPTLDCNFNCYYCFEEHTKGKMTKETSNNLFNFIISKIKKGIKVIKIVWYGGEPLLEIDFIINFTKKIMKICNEYNVSFFSGMITNGFLLTEKTCRILKELVFNTIQVTLDGEPSIHNKRRTLKNSTFGTFDIILNNLKVAKRIGLKINIRINIDSQNFKSSETLLKILKENDLNTFKIDLGYIENFNFLNCLGVVEKERFYSYKLKFNELLKKYGFKNLELYPKQQALFCGVYSSSNFVVNWNGDIFKCWSDIGNKDYRIGNINDEFSFLLQNERYDIQEIFKGECLNCNILPICAGGCPHLFLKEQNRNCSIYKFKLKEILEKKILKIKEEKNGVNS